MIVCENLVKIYKIADLEVFALQGLDLNVDDGEMMAIIGNSGSGKSTFLNMIGGLDRPSAGKLFVNGIDLLKMDDKQLFHYKRETVGFVWQSSGRNLISYLTATENVELPMLLSGKNKKGRAKELLEQVGLGHRMHSRLSQLSGGEQQRVAIAIALSNEPKLLLADEPTGSVDSATAAQIMDLLRQLNHDMNLTVIIVTHDPRIARKVDRVVAIRDGKTSSELIRKKSYSEELKELEETERELAEEEEEDSHIEYAVMDSAGRLQIPREYLDAVGMEGKNKMKIVMENGKIVLLPPEI